MLRLLLAILAVLTAVAPNAQARRGGREDHTPPMAAPAVSSDRAVAIARSEGLERLHEVKFDDGVWEVEGWTADGRRIELDIHPQTGAVLKREIYSAAPK